MRPATRLTTVVTPATNTDLTTLSNFKDEINYQLTDADSFIARTITAQSATAQNYCNRIFAVQTYQDVFWFQRDNWPPVARENIAPLQLSSMPATPSEFGQGWTISVSSVTEGPDAVVLVAGTDFIVDVPNATLVRLDSNLTVPAPRTWWLSPVTVIYSAGFTSTPPDVEQAVLLLVKSRWFGRTRDPLVRQQTAIGIYQATYVMGTGPGGEDDMTADAAAKLARYRVPVVG